MVSRIVYKPLVPGTQIIRLRLKKAWRAQAVGVEAESHSERRGTDEGFWGFEVGMFPRNSSTPYSKPY